MAIRTTGLAALSMVIALGVAACGSEQPAGDTMDQAAPGDDMSGAGGDTTGSMNTGGDTTGGATTGGETTGGDTTGGDTTGGDTTGGETTGGETTGGAITGGDTATTTGQ
jgi:hypothetical protein